MKKVSKRPEREFAIQDVYESWATISNAKVVTTKFVGVNEDLIPVLTI